MPEKCVVPGCNKTGGHRFPNKQKDPEKYNQWIQAIKRLKKVVKPDGKIVYQKWEPVTGREIVCYEHFISSDYRQTAYGSIGERKFLKSEAVPSNFPLSTSHSVIGSPATRQARYERTKEREKKRKVMEQESIKNRQKCDEDAFGKTLEIGEESNSMITGRVLRDITDSST